MGKPIRLRKGKRDIADTGRVKRGVAVFIEPGPSPDKPNVSYMKVKGPSVLGRIGERISRGRIRTKQGEMITYSKKGKPRTRQRHHSRTLLLGGTKETFTTEQYIGGKEQGREVVLKGTEVVWRKKKKK